MESFVMNTNIATDYAAADDETQLELHLGLRISREFGHTLSDLIKTDQWETAAGLLAQKYPEHRMLLRKWFAASRQRKTLEQRRARQIAGYRVASERR